MRRTPWLQGKRAARGCKQHRARGGGLRKRKRLEQHKRNCFGAAASRREVRYMIVFSFMMLMSDAARVVDIRLRMMAFGESIPAELLLMVLRK